MKASRCLCDMRSKTHDDVVAEEVIGEEARTIDPEVERRVVRKIDMFLMPAMVIGKLRPRLEEPSHVQDG